MATSNFPTRYGSSAETPDEPDALNEHVQDPGDPDGVVADEQRRHWQESHPEPPPTPYTSYRPRRIWPKILIVLVLLVLAVAGSFWIGSREAAKKQGTGKQQHAGNSNQASSSQTTQTQTTPTETKHYDSATYTLNFDYPKTWAISDTAAKLTATSPDMQLATAAGGKASVRVIVTIQNPQTTIAGFPPNGAVAALASDHVTYKQPSAVQRAQTYLSYLSYGAANGLDGLYVTGDNGYQQGQLVPLADVIKGNPLISVTFIACQDENCVSSKPATLNASAWQSSQPSKDVINLLESIVLEG